MPAHDFEVEEARAEGITLHDGWGIDHFTGEGRVQGADLKVCTCVFDPDGRFHPEYDDTQHKSLVCDVVIVAAGMGADTEAFGLETNGNHTLKADPGTLQTAVPQIFAAGDVVTGPTMITTAVGQGRRAAFMIDRYLQGAELDPGAFDEALPVVDKADVLGRQDVYDRREPLEPSAVMSAAPSDFGETEGADDRRRGVPRRRPLSRLRRVLRVPRLCRRLPRRRHQARHGGAGDRGRGRRRRSGHRIQALRRPTPSRSTATAATRT